MSDNGETQIQAQAPTATITGTSTPNGTSTSTTKPVSLTFDDLFSLVHTAVLKDFPVPGQSRTIKFNKLSGPDQTTILETLYKIRDAKEADDSSQLALILEQRNIAARMIAKYLVEPKLTEEQALTLNIEYVREILDAIQDREKELGEGSGAPTV